MYKTIKLFLSNEKSFNHPIIGNHILNKYGFHIARILISDIIYILRTLPFACIHPILWIRFQKDGYLVLENFLNNDDFASLVNEYNSVYNEYVENNPLIKNNVVVFGSKIPTNGGFDRCDGDSVNRFIKVEKNNIIDKLFCSSRQFSSLALSLFGRINWRAKHHIYSLIHGDEHLSPDSQRQLHRDTFHHAFKTWFYIDDIDIQDGAIEYIPGSHLSNFHRLTWEYNESIKKSSHNNKQKGGAFRISTQDLSAMNCNPIKKIHAKKNTLVIVNVKGFHRRGIAIPGSDRRGVYSNFRPWAFFPFVH